MYIELFWHTSAKSNILAVAVTLLDVFVKYTEQTEKVSFR